MDNDQLLQAIRNIVHEEVRAEMNGQVTPLQESITNLDTSLRAEINSQVAPLQDSLATLDVSIRAEVKDQVSPLRESLAKLETLPHEIRLLAEAQKTTNEKLENLQKQVNSLETKMEHSVIVKAVSPSVL